MRSKERKSTTVEPLPPPPVKPAPVADPNAKGPPIDKIVIKGNRKIEADAIRNKLVSKEGGIFNEDIVRQDIQELFTLGYFYNVEVDNSEGKDGRSR